MMMGNDANVAVRLEDCPSNPCHVGDPRLAQFCTDVLFRQARATGDSTDVWNMDRTSLMQASGVDQCWDSVCAGAGYGKRLSTRFEAVRVCTPHWTTFSPHLEKGRRCGRTSVAVPGGASYA